MRTQTQLTPAVNSNDHIQGNTDALIELVEYGDYQCPHCGHAYPIVKSLQQKLGDNLKFIFRNFPLRKIHPQAKLAAVATEAAARQGKFWEMHDIVFENQKRIHKTSIMEYAQTIGLDIQQFETDLENAALLEKVDSDFESGLRSGVNSTPSFYINGTKYSGDWEEEPFYDYIKSLLSVPLNNDIALNKRNQ